MELSISIDGGTLFRCLEQDSEFVEALVVTDEGKIGEAVVVEITGRRVPGIVGKQYVFGNGRDSLRIDLDDVSHSGKVLQA